MSEDTLYCYPGTDVLRNKLGIEDHDELERAERRTTLERLLDGPPEGNFDLDHLRDIHKHLFQDIYEWAGEVREVEISKGDSHFLFRQFIDNGMADVHRQLVAENFLRELGLDEFAAKAGKIMGDVNHVHPFREGNGRTQREYLTQLAAQAGHEFRSALLDREQWNEACKAANEGDYVPLGEAIRNALVQERKVEKATSSLESESEKKLREKFGERYAQELDELKNEQQEELADLYAAADRDEALDRHETEIARMKSNHAEDLARRIKEARQAQKTIERLKEERGSQDRDRDRDRSR